jgi:hypothetical protein
VSLGRASERALVPLTRVSSTRSFTVTRPPRPRVFSRVDMGNDSTIPFTPFGYAPTPEYTTSQSGLEPRAHLLPLAHSQPRFRPTPSLVTYCQADRDAHPSLTKSHSRSQRKTELFAAAETTTFRHCKSRPYPVTLSPDYIFHSHLTFGLV